MTNTTLSTSDFLSVDFQTIIADASPKTHLIYSGLFRQAAEQAHSVRDLISERVLVSLAVWTYPRVNFDSHKKPFPEQFLDSITESENQILRDLVPNVSDVELKARISDLAWIGKIQKKRDPKLAKEAILAYLASSEKFTEKREWELRADRIERALRLAVSVNFAEPEQNQVWKRIEEILTEINGEDDGLLSERLMTLLLEHRRGDATIYAGMARKCAVRALSTSGIGQANKARRYYYLEADWHSDGSSEQENALVSAAETYVIEANDEIKQFNNFLGASMYVQNAIQAYRNSTGNKHELRIKELHTKLRELNNKASESFEPIPYSPISEDYQIQAINEVKNKSLEESLRILAQMPTIPSVETLKNLVELQTDPFFEMMVEKQTVNAENQVIARVPSLLSSNPTKKEAAIEAHMYALTLQIHSFAVQAFIAPALGQIQREHTVRISDWVALLRYSPFIPPSRLYIYARGMQAGFDGDWLVATHLLVPQVENSIRYILEQNQIIASALRDGIQSEQGLDITLKKEELADILPPEIIFDLKALLIEQTGSYLRHKTCHGLASSQEFESVQSVYLWWLILNLCLFLTIVPTEASPTEASPTEASPTEASPTEASPTEASPTEASPTEASPTEASPTEASPTEASPTEASPTEASPTEASPTEASPTEASPTEASPTEASPTEASPTEASPTEASPTEASPTEASPTEASPTEASPTEASPTEASPTEASPTEASPTEASPTEASPTEASPTEASPTEASPTEASPTEAS